MAKRADALAGLANPAALEGINYAGRAPLPPTQPSQGDPTGTMAFPGLEVVPEVIPEPTEAPVAAPAPSGTDLGIQAFIARTWSLPNVADRQRERVHADVDPDDAEWFREWCATYRISHRVAVGQLIRDLRAANPGTTS